MNVRREEIHGMIEKAVGGRRQMRRDTCRTYHRHKPVSSRARCSQKRSDKESEHVQLTVIRRLLFAQEVWHNSAQLFTVNFHRLVLSLSMTFAVLSLCDLSHFTYNFLFPCSTPALLLQPNPSNFVLRLPAALRTK